MAHAVNRTVANVTSLYARTSNFRLELWRNKVFAQGSAHRTKLHAPCRYACPHTLVWSKQLEGTITRRYIPIRTFRPLVLSRTNSSLSHPKMSPWLAKAPLHTRKNMTLDFKRILISISYFYRMYLTNLLVLFEVLLRFFRVGSKERILQPVQISATVLEGGLRIGKHLLGTLTQSVREAQI